MSWQTGFTDTEIDIVLARNFGGRGRIVSRRAKPAITKESAENDDNEGYVTRQPLEGDECYCPICQDQMLMTQALSWCRKGCGNNIHAKVPYLCVYDQFDWLIFILILNVVYENVCPV